MTFQLPTTDEKADYVLKQFDRIAKKYDLANDLISLGMHRLWKHRAIQEMSLVRDGRYLDVCTGTGDLAMLIAGQDDFAGEVVGLDFSPEMLAVAKQRQNADKKLCPSMLAAASAPGFGSVSTAASDETDSSSSTPNLHLSGKQQSAKVSWQQGDAQALPFADNSFDSAIISFGLRNLTDLQKGLDEMARVVKPGGHVINLDLGQPDMPIFTPLFLFFFDKIVPIIGEIIQKDRKAYTYLPESRKNYPHPERLSEMFANAGLSDVKWHKLAFGSVALHVGTKKKTNKSLFISVGDVSADRHAAKLVSKLKQADPSLDIWGNGGAAMKAAGARLLYDVESFAVIGLIEPIKHLPKLIKIRYDLLNRIINDKPDAMLLMDFGGFNVGFATLVRKHVKNTPIVYFISPQVWGSRPWRINAILKAVTKMLVIFPFEEPLYRKHGVNARFVGHPVTLKFKPESERRSKEDFCKLHGLDPSKPIVGVFPGSRRQEIASHSGVVLEAISWLHAERPEIQFAISATNEVLGESLDSKIKKYGLEGLVGSTIRICSSDHNEELMTHSDLLWAKSGSTTLEATLIAKPMLIFYHANWITYILASIFKIVKYFGWPNLLHGEGIVPELIQLDCRAEQLVRYTRDWLDVPGLRNEITAELRVLKSHLGEGDFTDNAASEILSVLNLSGENCQPV